MKNKTFLFVLGRVFPLAKAEFFHLVTRYNLKVTVVYEKSPVLIVEFEKTPPPFWEESGGIVRVAKKTAVIGGDELATLFVQKGEKKLTFGISSPELTKNQLKTFAEQVKETLVGSRFSAVRYVLPIKGTLLSSIQVKKNGLLEFPSSFTLVPREKGMEVFVDRWVQEFERFSYRDYRRPYSNPKVGMLPPKVARMMVNLAFPEPISERKTLYDPFCGSGTILMEGALLGFSVFGSDIQKESVEGTMENLSWLKKKYPKKISQEIKGRVFLCNAVHMDHMFTERKIDAIVTEPSLGPSFVRPPTPGRADMVMKGLSKLYIGFLKKAIGVLKTEGRVVIIFPRIHSTKGIYQLPMKFFQHVNEIGFQIEGDPLCYKRKRAVVERAIYLFTLR